MTAADQPIPEPRSIGASIPDLTRVRSLARFAWYRTLQGLRMLLKLTFIYSPRGLVRVVAWLSKWIYDMDSAELRHQHAGDRASAEYTKVHGVRRANLHARMLVFGTVSTVVVGPMLAWTFPYVLSAIAGFVVLFWTVKVNPGRSPWEIVAAVAVGAATWWFLPEALALLPRPAEWVWLIVAAVAVMAFGWAGRPLGKPILKQTVLPANVVPPLRAPMVTAALCTLGNSKMKEPDDIRLLMDVARQGAGYQIDLELPAGVPAYFVQEKRTEFAAALRRELGCVWPSVGRRHPGHLSLYVSDEPMSKAKQAPWPLLKDGGVDLFQPVPMFTNNVGSWIPATFAYTGWVVGAVPRMGKTYLVRQFGLVAGLDVRAKVLAFDLKGTGDLSPLAKFAHAYSVGDEPEDIEIQLEWMRWVRAEMRRRTKLVRELTLEENPEKGKVTSVLATRSPKTYGPIVVCIDECQVWFEEQAEKAVRDEFIGICRDLIKRGPALGIVVMFATQKPDAKSIPSAIADNASARVCFKVNGQISNDQVLGTSSYNQGIRATQFGFEDKGVAYYRGEGADALIVRSVNGLDATAADKVADRARALRIAASLLTGEAAGEEQEQQEPQADLREDARFVLDSPEHGGRSMSLAGLCERLDLLRPGIWGHLDVDALGAALRAAGVTPASVYCADMRRSAQGVKREWLDPEDDARAISAGH